MSSLGDKFRLAWEGSLWAALIIIVGIGALYIIAGEPMGWWVLGIGLPAMAVILVVLYVTKKRRIDRMNAKKPKP